MKNNMLIRALGEFEVYQFMDSIEDFSEFYSANEQNFNIFEIANISAIETTKINDSFTVYDLTLAHSGEHFWLMKDELSGMYEPVEDEAEAEQLAKRLNA